MREITLDDLKILRMFFGDLSGTYVKKIVEGNEYYKNDYDPIEVYKITEKIYYNLGDFIREEEETK